MATATTSLWNRFQQYYLRYDDIGFSMDISRMRFADTFFSVMEPQIKKAFADMEALEKGAIANPDEKRRVGHYWLRQSSLAPEAELKKSIESAIDQTVRFAGDVHAGKIASISGKPFTDILVIGIGGSALGPQLVADALGGPDDKMKIHFLDNTDPDGIDKVFSSLGRAIQQTLAIVISKSGGTKETRNGMLEAKARFEQAGIPFGKHAVAITGDGSELDQYAVQNGWITRFPMWDWVGGRTSVMSTVGLVPAALQGLDIEGFLSGAAAMDARTRTPQTQTNAAMLLALMWYYAGDGKGKKDMVILPYKDRLVLFSKYLQQLVMESIGKEKDLNGATVHQGIAVYGNKGSTDQHAYVQQLRDGVNNFFATFIEVRRSRTGASMDVEPGVMTGDYLQGFLRGTRSALYENNRDSITLSIPEVTPYHLGALIGLYERAVGFYASLVNINAYHQPGVEAGKKAATRLLQLQEKVIACLSASKGTALCAEEIALKVDADPEEIYHLLIHLASNGVVQHRHANKPADESFSR